MLRGAEITVGAGGAGACNFGPAPSVEIGGHEGAAMSKVPDLQIEVQETLRRIIVKMPGTAYETRFGLIPRGLCFLSGFGKDDRKARITSQEFTVMAKAAATEKARELGWLTEENRQRRWADRRPTKRR